MTLPYALTPPLRQDHTPIATRGLANQTSLRTVALVVLDRAKVTVTDTDRTGRIAQVGSSIAGMVADDAKCVGIEQARKLAGVARVAGTVADVAVAAEVPGKLATAQFVA